MKRSHVVALTLGLLVGGSAMAQMQTNTLPLPTLGIRGGVNIARERVSPKSDITLKSQTFGAAGINYEFSVYQPPMEPAAGLSLRTDLMWVRTGGRFVAGNVTETDKVDELRLAPFLVYRFATKAIVPFIQAGPYAGYDLNRKYTLSGNVAGLNVATSGDIPNWRRGNFGLNAGLGFKIPTPAGAVSVDGRYSWGLINKNNASGTENNIVNLGSGAKRHKDGILIMAGYDFNLNRAGYGNRRY